MPHPWRYAFAFAGLLLVAARSSYAEKCTTPNGHSPCVDAKSMWWASGPTRFANTAGAELLDSGTYTTSLGLDLMLSPITLVIASPDPSGKEIRVVERALDASIGFAYGLGGNFQVGLALPIVLQQSGTGLAGVSEQSSTPLTESAVRDPRLNLAYLAYESSQQTFHLRMMPRLELSVPLGDENAFAGEAGFVVAPGISFSARMGRFHAASELGLRLRKTVELAGSRVGSQALVSLGFGAEPFARQRLGFGIESWLLPSIVDQTRERPDGTKATSTLVAAEWLATFHFLLGPDRQARVFAGAGTGIPLSRSTGLGTDDATRFGVTTAAGRFVIGIRYQPAQ